MCKIRIKAEEEVIWLLKAVHGMGRYFIYTAPGKPNDYKITKARPVGPNVIRAEFYRRNNKSEIETRVWIDNFPHTWEPVQ